MNASKSLSNISENRDMWIAQYRQEMRERDYRSGLSAAEMKGMKQGELKAKLETARILRQSNVDLSLIAKSTGLSAEEISRL